MWVLSNLEWSSERHVPVPLQDPCKKARTDDEEEDLSAVCSGDHFADAFGFLEVSVSSDGESLGEKDEAAVS